MTDINVSYEFNDFKEKRKAICPNFLFSFFSSLLYGQEFCSFQHLLLFFSFLEQYEIITILQ